MNDHQQKLIVSARKKPRIIYSFDSIHNETVSDSGNEEDLFKAYFDFAYNHTINAGCLYESAMHVMQSRRQKNLFLQLAYRKRDVINKLRMNWPGALVPGNSARQAGVRSFTSYLPDVGLSPLSTLKETLDFAYDKETQTLARYEKLAQTAHRLPTKALFYLLMVSQLDNVLFLDFQMSVPDEDSNCPVSVDGELEQELGLRSCLNPARPNQILNHRIRQSRNAERKVERLCG